MYFVLGFSPEYFNYDDLLTNDHRTNLAHAFEVAQQQMSIEKLLDPEGVTSIPYLMRIPVMMTRILAVA